ncbi:hypothetical protein [Nonomuraea jabiensis]|uniref:hypothetical protein n=1 Tax=Nonomuraea jabiensis TaxID=882448 RepID=UPI003683002F
MPGRSFFGFVGYGGSCPGRELFDEHGYGLLVVAAYLPPLWYTGAPAVVLGFAAHWLGTRLGRPRIGRVTARVAAGIVLAVYGVRPLAFLVDVAIDRSCVSRWGGPEGVAFSLDWTVAPTLAALCVLAAVRRPRHRLRALLRAQLRAQLRARWVRRTAAGGVVLAVLALVPVADLASGPVAELRCEGGHPLDSPLRTGRTAFMCGARMSGRFPTMPDHLLLAYGRRQCAAYPRSAEHMSFMAPICPPAAADLRRESTAERDAYARREAVAQAGCERARHRPRIRPVRVGRVREFSEIGMEAYEDHVDTSQEDPVLHGDLVGSVPGRLAISFSPEDEACVTAESYRRRPPVEVEGWDKVIEVGYQSPGGDLRPRDPMDSPELPNLAVAGKGHYRVRVHYRDAGTLQHLLIMVYPGRGDQVAVLKGG